MTQTANTKTWATAVKIEAFNFMETISPPQRIDREEFLANINKITKEEEIPLINDDWLAKDRNALTSVLRGLSEEGCIDRGSFAKYVD